MVDAGSRQKLKANPLFLREEDLREAMELLFFTYRDFTGVADEILAEQGFGRAHHRVIYFVGRNPGIVVTELLGILKITKQSLSRVLGQLVDEGYISQETDSVDRRKRRLRLTAKGRAMEQRLTERQSRLLAEAFRAAGAEAVAGFRAVLRGILAEEDRQRLTRADDTAA